MGVITSNHLREAVGDDDGLCAFDRDITMLDHSEPEHRHLGLPRKLQIMLKQAGQCHGIDAWRRIIRLIDSGRSIRLEPLSERKDLML